MIIINSCVYNINKLECRKGIMYTSYSVNVLIVQHLVVHVHVEPGAHVKWAPGSTCTCTMSLLLVLLIFFYF